MSLVLAVLVAVGFSRTVGANLFNASPPRPLLLWIHGAAFSTWVVFFMVQSFLVRTRKVSVHRLLGWFGAALATVMVVLGITVAVVMTRFDILVLHQKGVDAFLSVPFGDMIIFGSCIAMDLLEKEAGISSTACLHSELPTDGRCHRQIRIHVQPQPLLPRLGLSYRARHGARLGGGSARSQGVSLRAACNDRCAEFCNLCVASQSSMVGGNHTRDLGILTASRSLR